MADYIGEFERIAAAQREQARRQDYDDLNLELAGIDVGRMPRFLSKETREALEETQTGRGRSSAKLSALDVLLLNDPLYAQSHAAALSENRTGQAKSTELQNRIESAMDKLDAKIEKTLDLAVTLPDGRKAFMDKDGKVFTTENELVDPAIVEGIDWSGRPSHEHYLLLQQSRERLEQLKQENNAIGLRFGEFADRLEDEDNPPSRDEIDAIREQQKLDLKRVKEMDHEVQEIERRHEAPIASKSVTPDQPLIAAKFDLGS